MLPTPAEWRAWLAKLPPGWPPPAAHPGLDWLRDGQRLVLVTLRLLPRDDDMPISALAEPLTVSGCAPLVRLASDPPFWAFRMLSLEPQFFQPGLQPADAITRNILRAEARRHEQVRQDIAFTCCGFIDWLDQPLEDESNPLPYRGCPCR